MTGTTCGDHRPSRPHGDLLGAMGMMGTMWGQCGDDVGMTGMMWGRCDDNGDHVGTTKSLKMP